MSSSADLRRIALAEFSRAGYSATSLQRIAELAGLSKSSVLYHYASKEALLEAAIGPAIDRLEGLVDGLLERGLEALDRRAFIVDFVDFLLEHRNELHIFINQGRALVDVPVVRRANRLVARLAEFFGEAASVQDSMRFGMALAGSAYMLTVAETFDEVAATRTVLQPDETRDALVAIMTELLVPASVPR